MQKVVDNFDENANSQRRKLKQKIKETFSKENIKKVVNEAKKQLPSKEEIVQRLSKEGGSLAQQKLAETQVGLYRKKIDEVANNIVGIRSGADFCLSSIVAAEATNQIMEVIGGVFSTITSVFEGVVSTLNGILKILPPQVLSGAVVQTFTSIIRKIRSKVQIYTALALRIPLQISYHSEKLSRFQEILAPILVKIDEILDFIYYHYAILDTAYAKYLEDSNSLTNTLSGNDGVIFEDQITDAQGGNIDAANNIDDIPDPEILGKG